MWKNRPRIRWRMSQGAGNIRNKRLAGWPLAFYILYAAALSMLSLYAAYLMGNQFGLSLEERWPASLWWAAGWSLVVVAWNEIMHARRKRVLRLIGNVALFLVAYWWSDWWFFFDEPNKQKVLNGLDGLALRYMETWNQYFGTSRKLPNLAASTLLEQQWAWAVLWVVLAFLLQVFSGFLRKRVVMLLLPIAALAAGMIVGVTPQWPGMACMFAAGLLGLYLDCHREFRPVQALTLTGFLAVLLPLTAIVMEKPALRINQSHDQLQAFQHQVEQGIQDYDWKALFTVRWDGRADNWVDNRKPEYTKEEMLTVTVNELPDTNMYLRGYYGTEYRRGRWDAADETFDRACRRHGIGSGEAARLLAELSSPSQSAATGIRYELQYTGMRTSLAYLPYGADLETLQGQYRTSGDYVVEKSKGLKSLIFDGYAPGSLVTNDSEQWNSDVQKFYSWYNEYVTEQYLVVSGNLPELTKIVNEIETSDAYRTILETSQSNVTGRNAVKLAMGSLVARKLRSLASYNIDLDPLPQGVDPVEYFLGESHQGYCMHFASAGTLILRQLGVPARFVSGYVVQPDQFRRSSGGYRASVRDDAAHAWVEIWLENVGWVPVEMTPGYEEVETVLAGQDQQNRPTPAPAPTSTPDSQQTPVESEEQEDAPVPSSAPQSPLLEDGAGPGLLPAGPGVAGALEQPADMEGWGFAGEGGWAIFGQNGSLRVSQVVFVLLGILAVPGMVWLAVVWLLRLRAAYWQKIRHDIESGGTRQAVRVINRKMYRRLVRKRAGILALRSDEEYLAALKRQYPGADWESYLAVVRKAVYSREEIGAEEARVCYGLLRRTEHQWSDETSHT